MYLCFRTGNYWYYAFIKRHQNLVLLKKPQHLQQCRKDSRRPSVIYTFYEDFKKNAFILLHLDTEIRPDSYLMPMKQILKIKDDLVEGETFGKGFCKENCNSKVETTTL